MSEEFDEGDDDEWHRSLLVAYMLRTTQQHHVQLSNMADLKANILITAGAFILSLALGFATQAEFRASIGWAAALILVAMVYAVLAVLPGGTSKPPAVGSDDFNLLFFGHFSQLTRGEFIAEIQRVAQEPARAFHVKANDIYSLGAYLMAHKYRHLRRAYLAFLAAVFGAAVIELLVFAF